MRMVGLVKSGVTHQGGTHAHTFVPPVSTTIVVPRLHRMGTAGHLIHGLFGPNPTDLCPLRIVTTNRDRLTKIRENTRADGP